MSSAGPTLKRESWLSSSGSDEVAIVARTNASMKRPPVVVAPVPGGMNPGHRASMPAGSSMKDKVPKHLKKHHSFSSSQGEMMDRMRNVSLTSVGSSIRLRNGLLQNFRDLTFAMTGSSLRQEKTQLKYENTYRLEPKRKFDDQKVQGIIEETLTEQLSDRVYQSAAMKDDSQKLSRLIVEEVKRLGWERYRYVCTVSIGQRRQQAINFSSRCVWDTDVDTSATGVFENSTLFAVATVYALYLE